MPDPIDDFEITEHARLEMARRGISEELVRSVMSAPEQREAIRIGRDVLQRRVEFGGKQYLVRVIVDVDRTPARVVTTYRTSKFAKYWRA